VKRTLAAFLLLAVPAFARPVGAEKAVDLRGTQAPGTTFEALWVSYLKAERAGDAENARRTFAEIRRLRIERNVLNLDTLGLALTAQGQDRLKKGDRDKAEESFRSAIALAPNLPDGHLGLAVADTTKGPLGFVPAFSDTAAGVLARLPTLRGELLALSLFVPVGLLTFFALAVVFALAMLIRHGGLLRHDLIESFGPGRSRAVSLAFCVLLLLLPVVSFQGFAWLPLWWLALLFAYMSTAEKAVSIFLLIGSVGVAPAVGFLESRLLAARNPLFWAAAGAVDGSADAQAIADLDAAVKRSPDDRDLAYLLAAHQKKAGRYDEAAQIYRGLLQTDPKDGIAKNNLANLEFARGEFQSAIARYQQGAAAEGAPRETATFYYNQSLAHLQRFEYQPAQEAKSNADRLDAALIGTYDRTWKYDKGDYAVVDLGFTREQVWRKFSGAAAGVAAQNVMTSPAPPADPVLAQSLVSRFSGFVVIFVVAVLLVSFWRGGKAFTTRCLKCGTPFCRRCHLGVVVGDLCTQCHHLFLVRDGVSGPARNKKLLEVQAEDERRLRTFRILSWISPGAGQLYSQSTLLGVLFVLVWYGAVTLGLLAGRMLPVTEAPASLAKPWGLGVAALILVATWAMANRGKPEFEAVVPSRRGAPPRRGRS
jgi:Tfp pilus assembly protein PilF